MSNLPSRLLYRERYVAAVRPEHPLAKSRSISLETFCSYDHVLVSPTGGSFEGPTDEALARSRRRRTVRYSVPSFLLVPELLQIDDLTALVPSRLLRGHGERLTLGGSFVTLPALILSGLDARAANITSTIALFPRQVTTGLVGRRMVSGAERLSFRALFVISLAGGAVGAFLLLETPAGFFSKLVPWLVLIATAVFAWGDLLWEANAGGGGPEPVCCWKRAVSHRHAAISVAASVF
jgi:hypothetical protein